MFLNSCQESCAPVAIALYLLKVGQRPREGTAMLELDQGPVLFSWVSNDDLKQKNTV